MKLLANGWDWIIKAKKMVLKSRPKGLLQNAKLLHLFKFLEKGTGEKLFYKKVSPRALLQKILIINTVIIIV